MNIKSILLVFTLLWASSMSLSAQTLVSVNKSITKDTLLTTIQRNSINSKTVIASGQAVFSSKSGFVRILLSDDYGYDLLVYESSPLVAVDGIDNFSSEAIETVEIPSHLALTKIRVVIKNAELRNLSVQPLQIHQPAQILYRNLIGEIDMVETGILRLKTNSHAIVVGLLVR